MAQYPEAIEDLLDSFTRLPGVGRKTAERYVFFLLKQPTSVINEFAKRLTIGRSDIKLCQCCYNFASDDLCSICVSGSRNQHMICVVPTSATVFSLEQSKTFNGLYHVLGGTINQLDGIGPEQIRLQQLVKRVEQDQVDEVIIAMNPNVSGEATTLYITQALQPFDIKITRLARGLASGSDIEYADDITLGNALQDRKII